MPAYLRKITPRRCYMCDRPATVELRNRFNEKVADYCAACARPALKRLSESEAKELKPEHGEGKRA